MTIHGRLQQQLLIAKIENGGASREALLELVSNTYEELDKQLTSTRNAEFMVDEEYRSLFENATCGIYRDRLDGTPVRSNPALVKFNGYTSEAEYRQSLSGA